MLALVTRCLNEPYVNEFVNHYVNEGVDKIFIIDDNSKTGTYKDISCSTNVEIVTNIPFRGDSELNVVYRRIKNDFDWVIVADMDEYITTKKNSDRTLKEELLTTFKDADCVKIPWVMMAFNGIEQNPACLLETNIYRWNHDKKHDQFGAKKKFRCRYEAIEVKCAFKTKSFGSVLDHHPLLNPKLFIHNCLVYSQFYSVFKKIRVVDSVYKQKALLHPFYKNLREKDISDAFLLCFHYRIVSKQQCVDKLVNNKFYIDLTEDDLVHSDFPEIVDHTLCFKSQQRPKWF